MLSPHTEGKQGVNLTEGGSPPATCKHPSSLEDSVSFFSNCQSSARSQVHPVQLYWDKGVDCHSILLLPTSIRFLTKKQVSATQKLNVFTTLCFLATCSRHTILQSTIFNEYICFAREVILQSESKNRWLMMPL